MKYIDIKNEQEAFCINSDNSIIEVNIPSTHPEIILEDNSMVIFEDVESYYDILSDADIFIKCDQNFNIQKLLSEKLISSDTVSETNYKGENVTAIYKIKYNTSNIYYIQRTGINPLSTM